MVYEIRIAPPHVSSRDSSFRVRFVSDHYKNEYSNQEAIETRTKWVATKILAACNCQIIGVRSNIEIANDLFVAITIVIFSQP